MYVGFCLLYTIAVARTSTVGHGSDDGDALLGQALDNSPEQLRNILAVVDNFIQEKISYWVAYVGASTDRVEK